MDRRHMAERDQDPKDNRIMAGTAQSEPPPLARQLQKMEEDWDRRARENARHYVATGKHEWTDDEFFASGKAEVGHAILSDMTNVCQARPPKEMRVLEIGCGAGRVTRALAELFGEVHAVDVSGEMIERARQSLTGFENVHLYRNNGMDLGVLPDLPFDFAFSTIVFQHIANLEIIESYIREVYRLLRPGGLFKFQVNSRTTAKPRGDSTETWVGATVSRELATGMAERSGFEFRHDYGRGTQSYWLWFFKGTQARP
jgi:SAM-dependent methyltransferase